MKGGQRIEFEHNGFMVTIYTTDEGIVCDVCNEDEIVSSPFHMTYEEIVQEAFTEQVNDILERGYVFEK